MELTSLCHGRGEDAGEEKWKREQVIKCGNNDRFKRRP